MDVISDKTRWKIPRAALVLKSVHGIGRVDSRRENLSRWHGSSLRLDRKQTEFTTPLALPTHSFGPDGAVLSNWPSVDKRINVWSGREVWTRQNWMEIFVWYRMRDKWIGGDYELFDFYTFYIQTIRSWRWWYLFRTSRRRSTNRWNDYTVYGPPKILKLWQVFQDSRTEIYTKIFWCQNNIKKYRHCAIYSCCFFTKNSFL